MPKISIFLPIYNKANFLFRSIGSIQNQTLKNIEIIAVNDGSTDNSLKILKKLSKKDLRIKIINNDRNHGLLYSRAMGILNSTAKYVMNLDPDDKLKGNFNLEKLYLKAKKTKADLIIFLIERIPINKKDNFLTNLENKFQIQRKDYRITNKLIRKKLILKAYKYYYKYIYKNIWNFHEDNIWNLLVRKFSKKIDIFYDYIYIYRRNKDSLNMKIGSIIDINNRIYRLKLLFKFYRIFNRNLYYNDIHFYITNIILLCNSSLFSNKRDIKNGITSTKFNEFILVENLNNYETKDIANNILNIISNDKIILLINLYNKNDINYLDNLSLFHYLLKKDKKK